MDVYISSSCIKKEKISEVLSEYAKKGIRRVELSGGTGFYDGIEDDLRLYAEKEKMEYACHAYFPPAKKDIVINLASCNEVIYQDSLNHYRSCISMLVRLGIKTLSIHAGFLVEVTPETVGKRLGADHIYNREEAFDRFCRAYEEIRKICDGNGISLYLENNVMNSENYEDFGKRKLLMLTDFEDFLELKERLEFNLLLDLGHLNVSCGALGHDFFEECRRFKPYVKWLHISHNDGIKDLHQPLREDSVTVEAYRGIFPGNIPVTIEIHGTTEDIISSESIVRKTRD